MTSKLRISNEVARLLEEIELESLGPKLEALGVRGLQDLALVDDADLVRWGLTTIERRRFFGCVRKAAGDGSSDVLMPPSALTTTPLPGQNKAGAQRSRRPEVASVGPARLDELVGRGSAEYQVPRLAERLLAATGPLDVTELASRAARAAPALAQGYEANEWPQFVEACVRSYGRLMVEDGVLQGDRAIVSICSTVLFSASEEVVADTASWVRVVTCLATPAQVAVVACLCRSSREVADGSEVWSKLLARWYPKATLLNPDWVCQTELEKRLEQALENDYALAALTKRLEPDQPMDIGDLLRALPQQTTPKALVKFMSSHPEHFKQSPDGKEFCVSRTPGDLVNCKDWRTVNPFQMPPLPKKLGGDAPAVAGSGNSSAPAPAPLGRPKELRKQQAETAAPSGSGDVAEQPREVCQQLDPKVAFRLYHTGLLSQTSQQSKRGKLEAWEYYTESNSKCTMAAGDLLDLAESRVRAVRSNDPAVVHELVSQTIEGMVFKVPFGYWHRRVRVLTMALSASQLRVGREQRKKCERKLLEFMEWVKKERGFGYYQCDVCGSRWKSGFSYEEITQQCLQCGAWQRPYRIQDLESAHEREARERGEVLDPSMIAAKTSINTTVQPAINFEMPVLEHTRDSARGTKRPAMRADAGAGWAIRETPPQRPRLVQPPQWGSRSVHPHVEVDRPAGRQREASRSPARAAPATAPAPSPFWQAPPPTSTGSAEDDMQAQLRAALGLADEDMNIASTSSTAPAPAASSSTASSYVSGRGGFFAQRRAGNDTASSTPAATAGAASTETAPASRYTPGAGGFFASRRANSSANATPPQASSNVPSTASQHATAQNGTTPNGETPPSAEPPSSTPTTARYTPGSGGFFASRRTNSTPTPTPSEPTVVAADVTSPTPPAATSTSQAPATVPPSETPAVSPGGDASSSSTEKYKPGGGGFFARRRAATAGSEAPALASSTSSAKVELPPASASSTSSAKVEPGDANMESLAASLGLSVEEASAMGLLGGNEGQKQTGESEAAKIAAEEEAVAKKKAAEEAEASEKKRKEEADIAAKRKAEEAEMEAKKKAAEAEEAAKKKKMEEEAVAKRREEQEAAAAAKRKAEEEAVAKKKAEEEAARLAKEEAAKKTSEAEKAAADKSKTEEKEVASAPKPNIPADKLLALQTLGLSLEEAVSMGILPATYLSEAPAAKESSTSSSADVVMESSEKSTVESQEPPVKKIRNEQAQQELERRKEAAARFVARREGKSLEASEGADEVENIITEAEPEVDIGEERAVDSDCIFCECSDDLLVEAVNAVVTFRDSVGVVRIIAPQPSDVAYLASDAVFWPLLRRLAAEIACLEKGLESVNEDIWTISPASSEDARQYAETRGYLLPVDMTSVSWRRSLVSEVASDLMLTRSRLGRGIDLPALAGPSASHDFKWEERPADSLEGLSSKVDAESGERVANKLLSELEAVVLPSSGSEATSTNLVDRLTMLGTSIAEDRGRWIADGTSDGPVLQGGWSLLQMMGVREAAVALRGEYGVRRQILLSRMDITVQTMSASDRATPPASQRKFADILSRMWAGWRRSALEAPPLFEWSALAAARGMLVKATTARVSGPHARVSSKVKSFKIGQVPDRGGLPEGYAAKSNVAIQASASKAASSGSSRSKPNTVAVSGGANSTSSSSDAQQLRTDTPASGSDNRASSSDNRGVARVAGARPNKKQTVVGARSTNLELQKEHKAQQRKEREEGRNPNTYYEELGGVGARMSDAS